MSKPRGVEAKLTWFLSHNPNGVGMCAQHSWHALGGNQSPPSPPRWGKPHANAVYDAVKKSGRWFTGKPPRGSLVLWRYGKYGHAALSMGDWMIATTDPPGRPAKTGVQAITYPHVWGANSKDRIWTDQYAGVRFPIKEDEVASTDAYKYWYGGKPSKTQTVKGSYERLTLSKYDPKIGGLDIRMIYVNVGKVEGSGFLRIRAVRADGDKSAYHDYPITGQGDQLITHVWFENRSKGDGPTYFEAKCRGGLVSVVLDTRYAKCAVVRK